jgi:hypothetical protein
MSFGAIFRSLTCGFEARVPLNTFNSAEPRNNSYFRIGETAQAVPNPMPVNDLPEEYRTQSGTAVHGLLAGRQRPDGPAFLVVTGEPSGCGRLLRAESDIPLPSRAAGAAGAASSTCIRSRQARGSVRRQLNSWMP